MRNTTPWCRRHSEHGWLQSTALWFPSAPLAGQGFQICCIIRLLPLKKGWEAILRDPMGSAVRALSFDGETVEASAYDPFGKETECYRNILEGGSFYSPFGFGGYKKTGKKDIYQTLAREYNGDTGRFQTGDSEMYIHPYVPVSANLYQYAWNCPLKYADPMGRDVEESEWDRYVELGLTGYEKYGYHQIVDYMPDELMLVSGVLNPRVLKGSMAEAQLNGKWNELDSLIIKNNRAYNHGYTEGFWDFTLGGLEGLVMKPFNDLNRMRTYAGDVFSGRNTDNWFVTGVKLVSMPWQCVSGIPIYDSLDRMDEDIEKAKKVAEIGKQIMQMSPEERTMVGISAGTALLFKGAAAYNHYNAVLHSEEGVAQLFYNGGYGAGAVTGIVTDFIVGNAVSQELTQIGGRFGKRNFTSMSEFMSPEQAESYLRFQDNGSSAGLRAEELAGIQKVDEQLALRRIDYDEVLVLRKQGCSRVALLDDVVGAGRGTCNIVDTNGIRNDLPLTQTQIDELVAYAKDLGFPENKIYVADAVTSSNTGMLYNEILVINNDVLPTELPTRNPNSLVSGKGTIAHEVIGHYETGIKGTSFSQYDLIDNQLVRNPYNIALDEAQASIRAAKFAPNLTFEERVVLIKDGLQRLKQEGLKINDVRHLLDIRER